ncbi:MAG: VOC family protein [Rubrobacteraceae bacterium]
MIIQELYAVANVADLDEGEAFYTRLFGRGPDDRPMDGLIQWRQETFGVQLARDEAKAGRSAITIVTPSMAEARNQLADRGLELEPDIQGDYGIIAQISDPAGNRITLAEPPRGI